MAAMRFRFQFRLRTLLIFTAIVATIAAWCGWQRRIVKERLETLASIVSSGGGFMCCRFEVPPVMPAEDVPRYACAIVSKGKTIVEFRAVPGSQSVFRQWLGDLIVPVIWISPKTSESSETRIRAMFPESEVVRMMADPDWSHAMSSD
jgi:hypothetical protein